MSVSGKHTLPKKHFLMGWFTFCLFQGKYTYPQRSIFLCIGLCFCLFQGKHSCPQRSIFCVFVCFRENTLTSKHAFLWTGLLFVCFRENTFVLKKHFLMDWFMCLCLFQVKHTYPLRSIFFWIGLHVFVWFRENTFTSKEVFSYGLVYLLSVSGKIHLPLKKHFLMNWFMCF